MQPDALPAPDWYADPERPGVLRYWDGAQWTDHRAEPQLASSAAAPPKPPKPPRDPEETKFMMVVGLVIGGAAALIAAIVLVVVWVDSYNSGHSRGEAVRKQGIQVADVGEYCDDLAHGTGTATTPGGSGYWDLPWIIGCKRGLG